MTGATVDSVVDLYRRWGTQHYDEEITQLEHGLQCAALAVAAGASDELVAAALLHDLGHLLDLEASAGAGPRHDVDLAHESSGARYLAGLLPAATTAPIALHVRAKRYLCATDHGYAGGLSAGSTASLVLQGGPMSPEEAAAFERLPAFADAAALRRWDDEGKIDGLAVAPLDSYVPLLVRLAG